MRSEFSNFEHYSYRVVFFLAKFILRDYAFSGGLQIKFNLLVLHGKTSEICLLNSVKISLRAENVLSSLKLDPLNRHNKMKYTCQSSDSLLQSTMDERRFQSANMKQMTVTVLFVLHKF